MFEAIESLFQAVWNIFMHIWVRMAPSIIVKRGPEKFQRPGDYSVIRQVN